MIIHHASNIKRSSWSSEVRRITISGALGDDAKPGKDAAFLLRLLEKPAKPNARLAKAIRHYKSRTPDS
jgi:hypothetical protein